MPTIRGRYGEADASYYSRSEEEEVETLKRRNEREC